MNTSLNRRLLLIANRLQDEDNEYAKDNTTADTDGFDFDHPDACELYGPTDDLWMDEVSIRTLRDFILNCALYVQTLEEMAGLESTEFWEARENAYRIISALLVDLYQYDCEG